MTIIAVDIECSYGPMRPCDKGFYLVCVGIVDLSGKEQVFWFDHAEVQEDWVANMSAVRSIIEEADTVIAHNLKYDMTLLRNYDISFENQQLWCTMVTEYLLSGHDKTRTYGLDAVSDHHGLGRKLDKVRKMWDMGIETYDIPKDLIEEYVLQDCNLALELYKEQVKDPEMQHINKVHKLQMEFQLCLSDMELYGFKFDADKAHKIVKELDLQKMEMELQILEMAKTPNANVGSGQQLSAILFGGILKTEGTEWVIKELKSKPESRYYEKRVTFEEEIPGLGFKTPKKMLLNGYYPTDKATLEGLRARSPAQKEVKHTLLSYSVLKKARETLKGKEGKGLINKIGVDGMIHPHLNMAVTATGRLSSSDPNSQNLPRLGTSPVKRCIIPFFDGIMQGDLSQVEWRGGAELSQDQEMMHEINSGIDQHNRACVELMLLELTKENRNFAKIFNFRMIYGGSGYGFYKDHKMPNFTLTQWNRIVKEFCEKYWGLTDWQDKNIETVYKEGQLRIKTGRRFVFQRNENYEYNERQVKNFPVQGVAGGDILPLAAVVVRRGMKKSGLKSRMILTVHDALAFDYVEAEKERLYTLVSYVFKNLVGYIKSYFGIEWDTALAGEIEAGPNYAELKEISY
jgi:DNA polymerase I-like protein with 3'-5' exonuclease and polymerase domains